MKQTFKFLTSDTMSRLSRECRPTVGRLSAFILLFLSFGFNQEVWASTDYVVGVAATNSSDYEVRLNINRQTWGWCQFTMSKAGITFEGKKLYVKKYETENSWINNFQVQLYSGDTHKETYEFYSGSGSQGYYNNYVLNYDDKNAYSQLIMYKPRVYFNANGWSQTSIQVVVGHANYQAYYSLSKITNTNLYFGYLTSMDWIDAMGFGVVGGTSASDGTNWLTNVSATAKEYTGFLHYGLNQYKTDGTNAMYLVTNNGKTGQKPTCDYHSDYTNLNKTQTIKVMVKKAGASSYTETAYSSWPATIKAKRYKLNSNGASKADETDADLTSATFTSVITSAAKIYVPTPNTGYTFKGWGTSSSSTPSNASSAYEYTVEDTKTIYLFFDENTYNITATANPSAGGTVTPTTATAMGQISGGNITATNSTGYHFVNWTVSTATGTFGSATTANTTFKPTKAGSVVANFAEYTYAVTATYGEGGASATVTTSPAGQVTGTAINATAASGYIFSGWTITTGTGSFTDNKAASTTYYPTSASTLQATFARATVTVKSGISGHATLSGASATHTITIGTDTEVPGDEDVTFTVSNLDNGYEIEGWYTNSGYTEGKHDTGKNTYVLSSTNPNKNVYVKITPITYTITYNENGGTAQTDGTYTIESATITLPTAAQITRTNYTFIGWFDNSGLTGDAVTTIPTGSTGNKEYWAKWEETKYAVTLEGAQSPASPVQVGNVTPVTIVANTPTPGYYFVNWTKTGNVTITNATSATTTIKATGTGTVTANFAPRFYLRGSSTETSEPTKGMPGWSDDAKTTGLFSSINGTTATITMSLEAITTYKLKLGDLADGSSWGGSSAKELTNGVEWTFTSNASTCNAPTFNTAIAGTYTFTIDFSGASPKMKITYPTPEFTLQVAETRVYEESTLTFIAGDGSQANPYQFYLDEKMHLEITALPEVIGVQAQYKFGSDASTTTRTKDITATNTTLQSIEVKTYYKATRGSYVSEEKTETIYYQGVHTPALHLTASWNEKEESELSENPQVTIYYSTDNYAGSATVTQSTDGGAATTFMTITTEMQKNAVYQMNNRDPHRYDFAASATVNNRTFTATTSVSIYRLVAVRVKDTQHLMTKYYMWINGSEPLQEEAAWPGNDFIGKLGDWHIFLVKYPSYTHFVLNNGKNGDEEGAAQTVDVQLPATHTCYEIGAKGTDNKYAVSVAGACPPILHVGNIADVTLAQGESQLIAPEVDLDFGYNESQLTITFPDLPTGFTAVQQGKNFMLTGANQCSATTINVTYTLDGYSVNKSFKATVTHPSNILIQVKYNPNDLGWGQGDHNNTWLHYWGQNINAYVQMTYKDWVDNKDRYYAQIPLDANGVINFQVGYPEDGKWYNWRQTDDVNNVSQSGCYTITSQGDDKNRKITRDGDYCWAEYQAIVNMADGKTYYSNKVEDINNTISFYAPGKNETGNKSGLVRIIRNGTQVGVVNAATFDSSTVYTAKITNDGEGLTDVAYYTGDYYIRTDGVEGGWTDYKKESHKFTYFTPYEGALYDYYWVQNIKPNGTLNIYACIGNEYNENLANKIENSTYTDSEGKITPDASTGVNLRFGYNPKTNYFERSILRGSTAGSHDFLNIVGNNIFNDKSCSEELNEDNYTEHPEWSKFGDISNWVYEKNVYVKIDGSHPSAQALLKSKAFNESIIYQLGYTRDPITGAETSTPAQRDILSIGTTNNTYNIRVIYDFKTNRIVSAWSPIKDVEYSSETTINADVLFVRHEDTPVAQVNLTADNAKVSSLKSAYFVMEIDGSSDKISESIYWFSVPFDCEISSIFGVEGYVTLTDDGIPTAGTWGIQEYDGETRAKKGWYIQDTPTFWRWMRKNETLKKGNGYVLVFDRADANDKDLWKTISREEPCEGTDDGCVDGKKTVTTTVLRLYFPSSESGWEMTRSGKDQVVKYPDWTCTKPNRKAQDSNWRLLGTDSYSNLSITAEKQFERTDNDSVLDKAPNFVYEYHPENAQYKWYVPVSSLTQNFQSFYCYMVQFSGKINWNQYTQSEHDQNVVARRVVAENELTNAQMTLSLKKGDATEDNTYIYMDTRATTDFDNQMDLTKITDTRANQIYSVIDEVEYAGNTLPVEDQIVPLTVNINANGAYTFAMPEMTDGLEVYLMDNATNAHIDMAIDSYTVDLNKGKIADRFYLDVRVKERTTPTIIETIGTDGNPTGDRFIKVIQNDQLHIIRNGRIYNATGMKLNR